MDDECDEDDQDDAEYDDAQEFESFCCGLTLFNWIEV